MSGSRGWSELEQRYAGALDTFPELAARTRVSELPGGLTNHNLRIDTLDGSYVLRISDEGGLLAIDRHREAANSQRAHAAGVGARVVSARPDDRLLLVEFLQGRTLSGDDLCDDDIRQRVARSVAELHRGPAFDGRFDMVEITRFYRGVVAERGLRLPSDYDDFATAAAEIDRVLRATQESLVPCNNDLLAANFLDDGEHVAIIDYEYSGMNDPDFELGNLWAEAFIGDEHLEALVTDYYGRPRPDRLARARLFALLSRYGWTLWAAIQAGTSTIDFDFWSWGMRKYDLAVAEFRSSDPARWMNVASP